MATVQPADPLGMRRARDLLTPEARAAADRPEATERAYLDLLPEDLESTGATQDLMTTSLVPAIYERYWRPALARIAKGLTGPGNFSREFAKAVGDDGLVVGIDASRTMLERGAADLVAAGLANLALIRGDATALPFGDASFDAVCCFAALHLFADPFGSLDEMRRVLRPGGRIALMTSVRRKLTLPPLKPVMERVSGMRMFEGDEIVRALQERGFANVRQRLAGVVQFVGGRLPEE